MNIVYWIKHRLVPNNALKINLKTMSAYIISLIHCILNASERYTALSLKKSEKSGNEYENERYNSIPNQLRKVRDVSKCLEKYALLFDSSNFEAIQQKFSK